MSYSVRLAQRVVAAENQFVPGLVPRTWICPIDPAHQFSDDTAYIAHFATTSYGHELKQVTATAPGDVAIQTAPSGYQFVQFDIRGIFAKVKQPPPFMHIKQFDGYWTFNKAVAGYTANFAFLIAGLGEDKGINPDHWWLLQGGPTAPDTQPYVETFDPTPVESTVATISLSAYPLLEDGRPNTEDKLLGVTLRLWGYT